MCQQLRVFGKAVIHPQSENTCLRLDFHTSALAGQNASSKASEFGSGYTSPALHRVCLVKRSLEPCHQDEEQEKSSEGIPVINPALLMPPKTSPRSASSPGEGRGSSRGPTPAPRLLPFLEWLLSLQLSAAPSVRAGVGPDPRGQGDGAVGSRCC